MFFRPLLKYYLTLLFGMTVWSAFGQLQCENDTSYLRALIDLKAGYYLGEQGGLYPGGSNEMPYGHFAAGMNISRQVMPLNADGNIDLANGKAGFICLGASTAGNAFNHFKSVAEGDPEVNPCLVFANCAVGAKGLEIMLDTVVNNWYWEDEVIPDVEAEGITRFQVEVIWVMVTSRDDSILIWPFQPQEVANKYESLMPILLNKFPNLKQVYLSGFNYGGYADPTKEFYAMIMEPSSYWNNWSVKWLIERQIEGDPGLKYTSPDRMSPWLGWGPHLWADGLRANKEDKLRWLCDIDYKPDGGGYHLSNSGKDKVGKIIFDFFKESELAADWFLYGTRWIGCDPALRMSSETLKPTVAMRPNPFSGSGIIVLDHWTDTEIQLVITNWTGAVVYRSACSLSDGYLALPIDLGELPPGLYSVSAIDRSGVTASCATVVQ